MPIRSGNMYCKECKSALVSVQNVVAALDKMSCMKRPCV